MLNLDDFVDYKAEYSEFVHEARIDRNQLTGRCPFHDDKSASFSVNLTNGKWHCFTEDISGNLTSFYAKHYGIDTQEAYKRICAKYGKEEQAEKSRKKEADELTSYTLEEYSNDKKLPLDFLRDTCHLSTYEEKKKGRSFLRVPYTFEGDSPVFRKRYAHKEFRWSQNSGGKIPLYGAWRLDSIEEKGYAILVEGESDTQTLWYMQLPALGVPGATMLSETMAKGLLGVSKLYIHQEPDKGGETFFNKVTMQLKRLEYGGSVYRIQCKTYEVKDPSDLYLKFGKDDAKAKVLELLANAEEVDLSERGEVGVVGFPVSMKQPSGWLFSENGIARLDEKTGMPMVVCRTPIVINRRLRALDGDNEKIEIAFKRDNKVSYAVLDRSVAFSRTGIQQLADMGATVTSENAKDIVSYLEALEMANYDVLELADSTSTFGWQTSNRFLPGLGNDIVLDIDNSMRSWANAYHTSGSYDDWKATMQKHRGKNKFRFLLATSFSTPLLNMLNNTRIFMVYNWGDSKGGKTAGLKAALSVWGEPEKLMANFNSTKVALERMAGFYNDLPLGLDERQLAGQGNQSKLEEIVYMLSSGTGKARGNKNGGLQATSHWRTVVMATGEEPIIKATTQTGVATRTLEIYGGAFDNEKEAAMMHQLSGTDYGFAGIELVKVLQKLTLKSIRDNFNRLCNQLFATTEGVAGAHITSIAMVALADMLAEIYIFQGAEAHEGDELTVPKDVWDRALDMAMFVVAEQKASGVRDVNETATEYVLDWININIAAFTNTSTFGLLYGEIKDGKCYVIPSILRKALTDAGFDERKTLKHMCEIGLIDKPKQGDGYQTNRRIKRGETTQLLRVVQINLDYKDKKAGFAEVDEGGEDAELPFE